MIRLKRQSTTRKSRPGFTLTEILVASTVLIVLIVATLSLYSRSTKLAVDHNQFAELQQDVRSGMYFITRDVRMAGVGLPQKFSGNFLQGTDNQSQGSAPVTPDRLKIMGNVEDPLSLTIQKYQGGVGGASITLDLEDYSFETYPYPDDFYDKQIVLVLPNPDSGCAAGEVREIDHVTHNTGATTEKLNFQPGLAKGINPPGGLSGSCPSPSDYEGGLVAKIEIKEYWLDLTGNQTGLTAGVNGYIGNGQGNVLYLTQNSVHYPLARNVENLQFEYNGDELDDGHLDGFVPWQNGWTLDVISRIRQIRVYILGSTAQPFLTVSGREPANLQLYRRPAVSNTTAAAQDDRHRRFLLESTSNVRNMSLNIYNTGTR